MLAVNYTSLRDNMKAYMDKVTDDYETMIVTRKNNKNVVMLSEESYNNLIENIHVMGNKANYDWLMESKAQLESGKITIHNLEEDGLCILADRRSKDIKKDQSIDRRYLQEWK